MMKETIMIFNFQDTQLLSKLKRTLLPLHVYFKQIQKHEYMQPLGYLAGIKDIQSVPDIYEGDELEDKMLIFAGISDSKLDKIIVSLRKNGLMIPYKAVLTPTNQHWTAIECFAEIRKEHKAIEAQKSNS